MIIVRISQAGWGNRKGVCDLQNCHGQSDPVHLENQRTLICAFLSLPFPSKRDTSPRVKVLRVARNVDMSDAIPRLDAGLGRFSYTAGSKDTSQDLLCLIHLLWSSGISSLHSGGINSDNGSNSARWCAYDLSYKDTQNLNC